ncbi:MAG: class I SAM-dependent methyltransferase [Sedimentisphaerales bacterium]|nr:class I SAM-dependent methyltransferase [Sedimentisphaerales bacterium]
MSDKSDLRFPFGRNWWNFTAHLTEKQIDAARFSLSSLIGYKDFSGKTFIDVGGGSGLCSLAAVSLGAQRVYTFDRDDQCLECARYLRQQYASANQQWAIESGNILDKEAMSKLGQWDIVYSWGVLHHTGNMYQALENALILVKPGGILAISIYNDAGNASRFWRHVKRRYNQNRFVGRLLLFCFVTYWIMRGLIVDIICFQNPAKRYAGYRENRGMSLWHDWIDWLGGYPYEFAKPEEIFNFFLERNMFLVGLHTTNGLGCNQFVFQRN